MKKGKQEVMRVQHSLGYSCRAKCIVVGTPKEIVKNMFTNRSPFLEVNSLKKYMETLVKRIRAFDMLKGAVLRGKSHEARCQSFLKIMLKSGQAKELPFQKSLKSIK